MSVGRDPLVYLDDILESIEQIEKYVKGKARGDYEKDTLLQDAVSMRLQVIGESVAKLGKEVTDKRVEIPWVRISGLRNVISHEYAAVDASRIWLVIKKDLPVLKLAVEALIEELEG